MRVFYLLNRYAYTLFFVCLALYNLTLIGCYVWCRIVGMDHWQAVAGIGY